MIPKLPAYFDVEALSPGKLNRGFEVMHRNLINSYSRRYCYSSFLLDFTGLAAAHNAGALTFLIKPPFDCDIVGAELVSYEATGLTNITLNSTVNNWEPVSVTPAGVNTKARSVKNLFSNVFAGGEYSFTIAFTGSAFPLNGTYALIHIRSDRLSASATPPGLTEKDAPIFVSGETVSAAKLNAAFSDYIDDVNANSVSNRQMRLQVVTKRSVPSSIAAADASFRLVQNQLQFHSVDFITVCNTAGQNSRFEIKNASAVTQHTVNSAGVVGTSKVQGSSFTQTQGTGTDWFLTFSRTLGASTVDLAYAVIYYV
jgi:hypothetical protein